MDSEQDQVGVSVKLQRMNVSKETCWFKAGRKHRALHPEVMTSHDSMVCLGKDWCVAVVLVD